MRLRAAYPPEDTPVFVLRCLAVEQELSDWNLSQKVYWYFAGEAREEVDTAPSIATSRRKQLLYYRLGLVRAAGSSRSSSSVENR